MQLNVCSRNCYQIRGMKKIVYLVYLLVLWSTWSCNYHPDCCVLPQPAAVVTAQRNGTSWTDHYASGKTSSLDSLSIAAVSGSLTSTGIFNKVDTINFKIAYTHPGTYALTSGLAYYGMFNNGKLTSYKLDSSYNNVLIITGYQRLSNPYSTVPDQVKVTGTFSLKFVDPNNASGISFQNGNFYVLVPYL